MLSAVRALRQFANMNSALNWMLLQPADDGLTGSSSELIAPLSSGFLAVTILVHGLC